MNLLKVEDSASDLDVLLLSDILPTAWHANELAEVLIPTHSHTPHALYIPTRWQRCPHPYTHIPAHPHTYTSTYPRFYIKLVSCIILMRA